MPEAPKPAGRFAEPALQVSWDSGLEGVHLEIAGEDRSPVHVLAGPGTGKTFAMMRRIARFLQTGCSPDRILAVSFTRTAARDLSEQLRRLGVVGAEKVRATTLHSLCYSVLREEQVFSITQRSPRPLLDFEEEQLVNDLAAQFGGKRAVRALLQAYEAGWARLQHEGVGHPQTPADVEFEAALMGWLRYHRCMLIGELVPLTLDFLRKNPTLPVLPVLEHVLVDEYQDFNRADQALVVELAKQGSLTVIGDDNQSIYGFRFANPEGITTFPAEHEGTRSYVIDECRRCPPNIVSMSNSLISNNANRSRKTPLTAQGGRRSANVYVVQHLTVDDEVANTADFVASYLNGHPEMPPGQVLVLATRRFIGHGIRRALIQRRLNALSYFMEDELAKPPAAEGFTLLSLLANPNDRASLRAWLGLGQKQGGYAKGIRRVREAAEQKGVELVVVLDELAAGTIRLPHCSAIVARYRELRDRLVHLAGLNGLDLVAALWSQEDPDVFDIRLSAQNLAVDYPDPTGLVDALRKQITQPQLPDSSSDIVRVMSLHKSKGLTASLVIIAGCLAGALPTLRVREDGPTRQAEFEEQRRLFYVAVTRATDTLVISSGVRMPLRDAAASGLTITRTFESEGVRFAQSAASPFIRELGPDVPATISSATWKAVANF